MRDIVKPAALALALLPAGTAAAQELPTGHSPALLAAARSGDVAALEEAMNIALRTRLAEIFGTDAEPIGFAVRWDDAVCHEAEPVWVDLPPVGACLVPAGAMNVAASYAVIVPAQAPVSVLLLDVAVE